MGDSHDPMTPLRELAQSYKGAKSVCVCGHFGDGLTSSHDGFVGHGGCTIGGCPCEQFTWKDWTTHYKAELAKVKP